MKSPSQYNDTHKQLASRINFSDITAYNDNFIITTGKMYMQSNYKVYAYIIRHNYVLGGMLFAICKVQLHVSAINVGHLQVVQ
jgi:hypothetical protein